MMQAPTAEQRIAAPPRHGGSVSPVPRSAGLADLAALVALEQASFSGDRIAPRSWRRLLRRPSVLVLVVEHDRVVIGALVVLFRRTSRIARIYSIAVAGTRRGAGVGRALIEQAERAAMQRGCPCLRLETRSDNHPAQALFRRQGFAVTGRAPGYYQDGMTALRLEKRLAAA